MACAEKHLQIYKYTFYEYELLFTMAKRFYNYRLPGWITKIYYQLYKLLLKLHKTASITEFFQKN